LIPCTKSLKISAISPQTWCKHLLFCKWSCSFYHKKGLGLQEKGSSSLCTMNNNRQAEWEQQSFRHWSHQICKLVPPIVAFTSLKYNPCSYRAKRTLLCMCTRIWVYACARLLGGGDARKATHCYAKLSELLPYFCVKGAQMCKFAFLLFQGDKLMLQFQWKLLLLCISNFAKFRWKMDTILNRRIHREVENEMLNTVVVRGKRVSKLTSLWIKCCWNRFRELNFDNLIIDW
jgi:hypothetical protein